MAGKKICIKCDHASFLDPKKDICYKTGGLYCNKLREIVGKYEECRVNGKGSSKKGANKTATTGKRST